MADHGCCSHPGHWLMCFLPNRLRAPTDSTTCSWPCFVRLDSVRGCPTADARRRQRQLPGPRHEARAARQPSVQGERLAVSQDVNAGGTPQSGYLLGEIRPGRIDQVRSVAKTDRPPRSPMRRNSVLGAGVDRPLPPPAVHPGDPRPETAPRPPTGTRAKSIRPSWSRARRGPVSPGYQQRREPSIRNPRGRRAVETSREPAAVMVGGQRNDPEPRQIHRLTR